MGVAPQQVYVQKKRTLMVRLCVLCWFVFFKLLFINNI